MLVIESEQAVIGAAIYAPDDAGDLFEAVKADHFHEPVHARIWAHLARGGAHDQQTLALHFANDPALADLGGVRYFGDLIDKAYLPTAHAHAVAVVDAAMRRQIHGIATAAAAKAATSPGEAERIIADLERGAADIAREKASSAVRIGDDALDNLEKAWRGEFKGEPTGLDCIDRVTGGLKSTDVWFIGGRTSMGKSVVGLEIARGVAQAERGVMIFSKEMPKRECQMRMIASLAHERDGTDQIRYGDLLKGNTYGANFMARARAAATALRSLPIFIDETGGLTIDEIRSRALRQVRTWEKSGIKPGCIIIDHIGLVQPTRKTDNKAADTADTVNQLKPLAKQLQCAVVAMVQVNRQTEGRDNKRPTVADLNWSGAIEQIADFVGLLYRESYYLDRSPRKEDQDAAFLKKHDMEIIVAKNRSGPICTVKAWVDVACNVVLEAG